MRTEIHQGWEWEWGGNEHWKKELVLKMDGNGVRNEEGGVDGTETR